MRRLGGRIGPYRVAALLIGCALVLEVLRVRVLAGSSVAQVTCTLGEVVFLALSATVFITARRRPGRERSRDS
jgi:hypothetical protein